jgi:hypothetical protein
VSERRLAMLAQGGPLLGTPAWAVAQATVRGQSFALLFSLGLFMVVAGVMVGLALLAVRSQVVRWSARSALRFQAFVVAALALLAVGVVVAMGVSPGRFPSEDSDGEYGLVVLSLFVGGVALPIVEAVGAFAGMARAWRATG